MGTLSPVVFTFYIENNQQDFQWSPNDFQRSWSPNVGIRGYQKVPGIREIHELMALNINANVNRLHVLSVAALG